MKKDKNKKESGPKITPNKVGGAVHGAEALPPKKYKRNAVPSSNVSSPIKPKK